MRSEALGSEDQGVGKPLPKTTPVQNISNVPQWASGVQFAPGETKEIDPEIAHDLLSLPFFELHDAVVRGPRPGGQQLAPTTDSYIRELRRALWPDPTPEAWVSEFNDSVFPCQTDEFAEIEKADETFSVSFRVLNIDQLHGGNRVIFRVANYLARRGHDVSISTRNTAVKSGDLKGIPIRVSMGQLEDADFVVGTFWTTITEVATSRVEGRKVAFMQSDEPSWMEDGHRDKAESIRAFTYPGVKYIPISAQVGAACQRKYSTNCVPEDLWIPGNGVDCLDFSPRINDFNQRNEVCAIYRGVWFKGDTSVLNAMAECKRRDRSISVKMAGFNRFTNPVLDEYVLQPPIDDMALFYSTSDVYLSGSRIEGSPLPPLEAMACGCIPIVPEIGTEEYLVDGENGFIIDPNDIQGMADAVMSVYSDDALRRRMIQNCLITARSRPWSMVGAAFERALVSIGAESDEHHQPFHKQAMSWLTGQRSGGGK